DPVTLDTTYNVVKAKKSEESVVRVITKDAQGNLVGNPAFILTPAHILNWANSTATNCLVRLVVKSAAEYMRNIIQSSPVPHDVPTTLCLHSLI
ncbi:hypothetical protein, partial [Escherichia coli]|uniref:hypothetical protein n=1 Tax=Escherichia coli TaxID=562 RepID=UPI001BAEA303